VNRVKSFGEVEEWLEVPGIGFVRLVWRVNGFHNIGLGWYENW